MSSIRLVWSLVVPLSLLVPFGPSQDWSLVIIPKGFLADGTVFDSNEGKDPIRLVGIAETKTNTSKKKDVKKRRSCKRLIQISTWQHGHLVRFVLGEGKVIAGWEKGLEGTCAGEKVLWP